MSGDTSKGGITAASASGTNMAYLSARRQRTESGVSAAGRLPETGLPARPLTELDVSHEAKSGIYWCYMQPQEKPSFTPQLLADLEEMQHALKRLARNGSDALPQYYVLGSKVPGIFNLGGDLLLFADKIRRRDRHALQHYAEACIHVLYNNAVSFELPIVTIALVQGDALGGGFEAALSCDIIIAERGTRFGLPEVLFNLFPGMGAYSFLSRKLGAAKAEKMILSGRIYTAEELHQLDLVEVLAEPGTGEAATRDFISRNRRRHNAQTSVFEAGRRVSPISYGELHQVTELWVEAALRLTEVDLRKMERLSSAQSRRWTPPLQAAANSA